MSGTLLPNAALARIADAKVRDFILDVSHIGNKGRAEFFFAIGFSQQRWETLKDALLAHPTTNTVERATQTEFGTRYRVRCNLESPNGRNPCIVTVWALDHGSTTPTFITAFPGPTPTTPATP